MTDRIESISSVRRTSIAQELADAAHAQSAVASQPDKVSLSLTAKARLLKDRGASVDEIASELGITIAVVLGTLNLSNTTSNSELSTK